MEVLLETYYILLPIVATALIGWVGVLLKDQKKKEKDREEAVRKQEQANAVIRQANSRGIMLVLRYILQRYHAEYMLQGTISYTQYREWLDFYNAYKTLHGNSVADDWNEDVERMEKTDRNSGKTIFELLLKHVNDDVEDKDK